jgi:hypothetical protein
MLKKVIGIGVVVLLIGALVGGGAYLLLRDSGSNGGNAGGGRGGQNQAITTGSGADGCGNSGTGNLPDGGYRGGQGNNGTAADLAIVERGGRGGNSGSADQADSGYRGGKTTADNGAGTSEATVAPEDWLTVSGVVVEMEEELVVRTAAGEEFTFGLGPSWYRDSSGVTIAAGDEVRVTGFYEDGELKAGTVENLSAGQVLALRNESGQPLWSGRGRQGQ